MFGTNEIVGQKFFKDAPPDSLYITSMFFTLQGEGPFGGLPALFLRLTKCNLACSFCDTFFDAGDWITFEAIEAKAKKTIENYFNGNPPPWAITETGGPLHPDIVLVITGGEPTLQKNLTEFLRRQVGDYKAVQIESNGTVNLEIPKGVTLVCSPKCAEKDGKATKYLAPTKQILQRADCLKFVMSADQNSPYCEVPEWVHEWKARTGCQVYISPMNMYNDLPHKAKVLRLEKQGSITMEERSTVDEVISFWEPGLLNMPANQINHEYAAKYCMTHGFRLNLQVHLYASLA
ncbi:MAG: 7-carboxy-7-deazaguanine synthase QueE [Nitrososphaerales archaeon]